MQDSADRGDEIRRGIACTGRSGERTLARPGRSARRAGAPHDPRGVRASAQPTRTGASTTRQYRRDGPVDHLLGQSAEPAQGRVLQPKQRKAEHAFASAPRSRRGSSAAGRPSGRCGCDRGLGRVGRAAPRSTREPGRPRRRRSGRASASDATASRSPTTGTPATVGAPSGPVPSGVQAPPTCQPSDGLRRVRSTSAATSADRADGEQPRHRSPAPPEMVQPGPQRTTTHDRHRDGRQPRHDQRQGDDVPPQQVEHRDAADGSGIDGQSHASVPTLPPGTTDRDGCDDVRTAALSRNPGVSGYGQVTRPPVVVVQHACAPPRLAAAAAASLSLYPRPALAAGRQRSVTIDSASGTGGDARLRHSVSRHRRR